ncbi:MAG TPA: hypothetical protein VHQ86_04485 [Candidatus Saccharimonadia bacterium]|jgi:hypothetical protein|nr:hypothetical protein [Candidatus Saccharimonadia bacterium]
MFAKDLVSLRITGAVPGKFTTLREQLRSTPLASTLDHTSFKTSNPRFNSSSRVFDKFDAASLKDSLAIAKIRRPGQTLRRH